MPYKDKEKRQAYSKAYQKQWNAEHADTRRKGRREWVRQIRKKVIQLLGGGCVRCGYDDERALEIDHIIPIRSSGKRIDNVGFFMSILRGEYDNVQLLCANCHRIKTYEELLSDD